MNKIKNKFRQLNYRVRHDYLTIENVVLAVAILLCLVWTYQSIAAMSKNWELSEKLTTERKTLELLGVEVEALELENEYYKSDEYQELLARRFANKKLAGENMIYLPENSETAKNKHKQTIEAEDKKLEYSNFEKWMMFLFPSF